MTKMIPPVPTSAVMMPTPKQKIGFSIESIVGNDANSDNNNTNTAVQNTVGTVEMLNGSALSVNSDDVSSPTTNNAASNGPTSPPQTPPAAGLMSSLQQHHSFLSAHAHPMAAHQLSMAQQHALHQHLLMQQHQQNQPTHKPDISDILQRLHNTAAAAAHINATNGPYSPPAANTRLSLDSESLATHHNSANGTNQHPSHMISLKRERSPDRVSDNVQNPAQRHQPPHTPPKSVSPQSSSHASPPPSNLSGSPATPQHYAKLPPLAAPVGAPLLVPGMSPANIVRPFPVGPPPPPPPHGPQQGMSDIKALPPYINAPPELPPQHNPHLIAAAQFQMALQAGHVLGPAAAAAAAAGLPPHAAQFMAGHAMPRDSYPLYPWLLSRHGRIFPHRFPGSKYL